MISAWKMRRELNRFGQQCKGLLERITDPVAQRKLDRAVAAGLPATTGAQAVGAKVALFLIFQPNGVSDSTLETCRMLVRNGYAPLVVSNASLTPADTERLAPFVWKTVERPNFGYDFGGYRDGLTYLSQCNITPDELLILNDSTWLPVASEADLFDLLDGSSADIAGTILRVRGAEQFLESYLYRVRRSALDHPAFAGFWKTLKLTSNKYYVIRRGERGFSAAMRHAGLQVEGVYDGAVFLDQLSKQDDDFLRLTLQYGAYVEQPLAQEAQQLLQSSHANWRSDVLAHIQSVLVKRQAYSSFPYASVRLTGYPLVKKSGEPISKQWRLAYLRAVEANDLPAPSDAILREIRDRDRDQGPKVDRLRQ